MAVKNNEIKLLRASYFCASADAAILSDGAVAWQGEEILEVGVFQELRKNYPEASVIDCPDQIVLPGLVNAHEHGRGIGSRRMGISDGPLETWMQQGIGSLSLDPYLSALYNGLLMIASGVTTTMHFHRNAYPDVLEDEIAKVVTAYQEVGLKVCVGIPFKNRNMVYYGGDQKFLDSLPSSLVEGVKSSGLLSPPPDWRDVLALGNQFRENWAGDTKKWVCWAPANVQWCSEELLGALASLNDGVKIQIHLVESLHQQEYGYRVYGITPVAFLNDLGFLSPLVSCAHAVWLTDRDIQLLAQTGASVAHNPSSNLRLRNGICRVLDLLSEGVPVGIGLDGQSINDDQDMLQEIRLVRALGFDSGVGGRSISTRQVMKLATEEGARVLGAANPRSGRLEKGFAADLATYRLDRIRVPFLDDRIDPLEAVISYATPQDTHTVVISGEVCVRDGKHVRLDKLDVEKQIQEALGRKKTPQEITMEQLAADLQPYFKKLYSSW